MGAPVSRETGQTARAIGLLLGPIVFVGTLAFPQPEGVGFGAWLCVGLLGWMATWWVSEAIPIPITSLLPLVILPFFGVVPMASAAAPYFSPIIVLLLGGFIAAMAVERWGLHERLALLTILQAGSGRRALIAGFLAASALLSAWISNTATSIMLMPVALSVAAKVSGEGEDDAGLTISLVLAVAYGASIGGLATPVGTPTNLIVMGAIEQTGDMRLTFDRWMMLGVPTALALLPAAWLVLTSRLGPSVGAPGGSQDVVRDRLERLGRWTTPERRTLFVFSVIAFFWVFRRAFLQDLTVFSVKPFAGLSDPLIAVAGAIAMFIVPSGSPEDRGAALLDWDRAKGLPWDVLLLFGGGLSMAAAITSTGLGDWLGAQMSGLSVYPILVIMVALTIFVIFATEFTSNVATAATLMPVILALSASTGMDAALLALPVAMAASCAFMFPMATAPNAIAYGTGAMSIAQMARIGIRLNLMSVLIIALLVWGLAPFVLR